MRDEDSVKFPEGDLIPLEKLKDHHIENATIRCTACWTLLDVKNDPEKVKKHPDLGTILCLKCKDYYGVGEFSQDEDGDNYCRWCAEGGHLIACDSCKNAFCDKCIRKNFGRTEQRKIKQLEVWNCYVCDSKPLKPLINASKVVEDYIDRQLEKSKSRQKKKLSMSLKGDKSSDFSGRDGKHCWLDKHFLRILNNLDTDKRTVRKIKSKLESHRDVPRRVHRCSLKLQDYIKQHLKECNTLLESLKIDSDKHKCDDETQSLNKTSDETTINIEDTINDSVIDESNDRSANEPKVSSKTSAEKKPEIERIEEEMDESDQKDLEPVEAECEDDQTDLDKTVPLIPSNDLDTTVPFSTEKSDLETTLPKSNVSVKDKKDYGNLEKNGGKMENSDGALETTDSVPERNGGVPEKKVGALDENDGTLDENDVALEKNDVALEINDGPLEKNDELEKNDGSKYDLLSNADDNGKNKDTPHRVSTRNKTNPAIIDEGSEDSDSKSEKDMKKKSKSNKTSSKSKAKSDEDKDDLKVKSDKVKAKSSEDEVQDKYYQDEDEVKLTKSDNDDLRVDLDKIKQSRREKLSSTYRKKNGSPNSKKSVNNTPVKSSSSPQASGGESVGSTSPTRKDRLDSDSEDIFNSKNDSDIVPVSSFLVEVPEIEQSKAKEQASENSTKLFLSASDDDDEVVNKSSSVPVSSLLVENLEDIKEISVKTPKIAASRLFLSESDGNNTEALPESSDIDSPKKRASTNKTEYERPSPNCHKKIKQNLKSLAISMIGKDSSPDLVPIGDKPSSPDCPLESTVLNSPLDQEEKTEIKNNKNEAAKEELLRINSSSDDSDSSKKKVKKKKRQTTTKVDLSSDEDSEDDFKKPRSKKNIISKSGHSDGSSKENIKKVKEEKISSESDVKNEVDYDNLLKNDKKIISNTEVVIKKLPDNLLKKYLSGEIKSINSSMLRGLDSDDDDLLDRKIARLAELPSPDARKNTPSKRSVKISVKRKLSKAEKPKINLGLSDSVSDMDNEKDKSDACSETNSKFKLLEEDDKENLNAKALKDLLNEDDSDGKSDDSVSSLDSGKEKTKKKAEKKPKTKPKDKSSSDASDKSGSESSKSEKGTDSSDDFVLKKKRRKYDKLLDIAVDESSNASNKSEKSTGNKGKGGGKKAHKRKLVLDSDSSSDQSSSLSSLDSDSVKTKKAPTKKRRRIRKIINSSDSDSDVKEVNEDGNTPGTPGSKGRKNIKKVIGEENLDKATKRAALAEKERRKRVLDRQKHYNSITEGTVENGDLVTRKLVLEVHKESKQELVEIPPDIVEKLKPHQVNGVKFMWECVIESLSQLKDDKGSGCVLAHCMGLGKTLQVIAFLATLLSNPNINKKIKKALVVCPYNTILNWAHEFKYWLKNTDIKINVFQMQSAKTHYDRADILERWNKKGGVMIISYDAFRNLTGKSRARVPKKIKELYYECLVDPGADIVICDEGHILKNSSSAIAKAMQLIRTGRRIVLTGTPLQNNLKEYHTMVHFVKPHLIGTEKEFRNRFVNPINNGQCADSTPQDVKLMKKRVHILHKLLEGCVQRCDYSHVAKFLPPKCEYVLSLKLSDKQIALYKHYLEFYAMNKGNGRVEANGTQLFKDFAILRLIWTHPLLMKMNQKRVDDKAWKDDLINDEDEDSMGSFIDDGSGSSSTEDVAKPSTSKGVTKKTSASDSNSSVDTGKSSGDEVISKWTTRKRNGTAKESEPEVEPIKKQLWWEKIVPEDEIHKIETSGKMLILFDILRECSAIGDKVLIFSQSLLTLNLIEELLNVEDAKMQQDLEEESMVLGGDANLLQQDSGVSKNASDAIKSWCAGLDYFRMDGSTSADMRKKWIEIFNDRANERARLFLISTKAGSLGTNLIGANRVILMDASWNPTHDVQAIFRVYRFGQIKPVYIYRFLAQGTMEEKIYDRQVTKQSLACRVVDEQQIERHFNAADLAELYSFTPDSASKRPTPMIPKDRLLADMILRHKNWIVSYHEHDSLLENLDGEDLTEDERKTAWTEYENEREGISQITNEYGAAYQCQPPQDLFNSLKTKFPNLAESNIFQIMSNYLATAVKRRQELYKRNTAFAQQRLPYPPELLQEVQKLNSHIDELNIYLRNFKEKMNRDFLQQKMQEEILQQQRARHHRQYMQSGANANMEAKIRAAFQQNVQMQFQQFARAQQAHQQRPFIPPQFQQTRPNIINPNNRQTYTRNINVTRDNLQARNDANSLGDMSKILNDLKSRNININIAGTSGSSQAPSQAYKVSYESPKPKPTKARMTSRGGPIITEVDDDLPIPVSSRNDNNPVITEID